MLSSVRFIDAAYFLTLKCYLYLIFYVALQFCDVHKSTLTRLAHVSSPFLCVTCSNVSLKTYLLLLFLCRVSF